MSPEALADARHWYEGVSEVQLFMAHSKKLREQPRDETLLAIMEDVARRRGVVLIVRAR